MVRSKSFSMALEVAKSVVDELATTISSYDTLELIFFSRAPDKRSHIWKTGTEERFLWSIRIIAIHDFNVLASCSYGVRMPRMVEGCRTHFAPCAKQRLSQLMLNGGKSLAHRVCNFSLNTFINLPMDWDHSQILQNSNNSTTWPNKQISNKIKQNCITIDYRVVFPTHRKCHAIHALLHFSSAMYNSS